MMNRQSVRRLVAGVAAVLMFASVGAVSATPVAAAPDHKVTGSVTGTAPFTFGPPCSFVHQHFLGTITPAHGRTASIDVDVCGDVGGSNFPMSGTFEITDGKGLLTGTATGAFNISVTEFSIDLVVVERSHGLASKGATLQFNGTWFQDGFGGPIVGTITS
jgi:hypothetical protein